MNEIVERLRRQADVEAEEHGMIPDPTGTLYWEAAAEIERLEAENERLRRTAGEG